MIDEVEAPYKASVNRRILNPKCLKTGPREPGGAVDLITYYKLWSHNVVGDTDVQKGEGMELDQLLQNASHLRERNACIYPFDLDLLRDAFHMRETTPVNQPFKRCCNFCIRRQTEKGIPTATAKLKSDFKDREKGHRKHKDQHSDKDSKKKIHCHTVTRDGY
ncbi:mediator of RNA polymerase II transcription subunit 19a isoform X2 [Ziziphus jujuba]|uniref:Mediator of RNA polymerase II transcription subunit 19a isoform X2 n=1 Tax=Ziziphus jujuba TaxID=326968 RepID=A0ABM3IXN1_ZIZJJ|nr:mediator of RNA polymerase II transcription subunit 19a isoform X2 [Ziziphus jujuba]